MLHVYNNSVDIEEVTTTLIYMTNQWILHLSLHIHNPYDKYLLITDFLTDSCTSIAI